MGWNGETPADRSRDTAERTSDGSFDIVVLAGCGRAVQGGRLRGVNEGWLLFREIWGRVKYIDGCGAVRIVLSQGRLSRAEKSITRRFSSGELKE